ncbi:hypothetical protein [Streptomyces muensis]|uniref:Uncharacterized protein n=1 Tax=Streptomyces muensis TaxID=1077944 RepID=A0A9X1PTT9_STRM4|nr:hypothetical protein [Streptomyces muensis]MCF1592400.1 hypothetical protein [Streptomyces muensis]
MRERRLAVWEALNERQQAFVRIIYDLDQENEANRAYAAAQGKYDKRPASEWRQIDFTHEPYNRDLFGITTLQSRLEWEGYHNQGNGATMTVLIEKDLIEQHIRATRFGIMHTVLLTREGRAVYRAAHDMGRGSRSTVELSDRSWQVLGYLWSAHQRGKPLSWTYSTTIEKVLIDKYGLAEEATRGVGYQITEEGRRYYRQHWTEYAQVYPEINAPHPDGIVVWPKEVDAALVRAGRRCDALAGAWRDAWKTGEEAGRRAAAESPEAREGEEPEIADLRAERYDLAIAAATREAELAEQHKERLEGAVHTAAWTYVRMAVAAFTAAVDGTDPQAAVDASVDDTAEVLPNPKPTGLRGIDTAAVKHHAAAIGKPLPRKGPPPRPRRRPRSRYYQQKEEITPPPAPCSELVTYAGFLVSHVKDGDLQRTLHAEALAPQTSDTSCTDPNGDPT